MKNGKSNKLDKFISKMRREFPHLHFINVLRDKGNHYNLGADYAIIVKNIKNKEDVDNFNSFIINEIWLPLIGKDEELPLIITL